MDNNTGAHNPSEHNPVGHNPGIDYNPGGLKRRLKWLSENHDVPLVELRFRQGVASNQSYSVIVTLKKFHRSYCITLSPPKTIDKNTECL